MKMPNEVYDRPSDEYDKLQYTADGASEFRTARILNIPYVIDSVSRRGTDISVNEEQVYGAQLLLTTSPSSKQLVRDRVSYINKVIKRRIRLGVDSPSHKLSNEVLLPLFINNKSVFNFETMLPPPTLVNPWLTTNAGEASKQVNDLLKNWLVNDVLILPTANKQVFHFKVKFITGMVVSFTNAEVMSLNHDHSIITYLRNIIQGILDIAGVEFIDITKW